MPNTKASLLIVDDELSIRTTLSLVLTEIGHSVRTAENGFSALAEILDEIPEILISDLNMPGMSGFQLLSVVRRKYPTIQTVAMSGAFAGDEVPSGVAADAFYQKGSSLGSLLMIIGTLPQMERRQVPRCRVAEPLWVDGHGNNSSAMAPNTLTCPACQGTSLLALDGVASVVREIHCVFCGNSIQFPIVESSTQTMLQAFQPDAQKVIPGQSA
jgi:CheY-like chemotaxis protein